MRENIIKEYLSRIDFGSNWNYNSMREDLRRLLGEEPAIEVNYIKDVRLNEIRGKSEEIKVVNSIDIVYTGDDNRIKKMEFKLGRI
jgi:hypothetical protein